MRALAESTALFMTTDKGTTLVSNSMFCRLRQAHTFLPLLTSSFISSSVSTCFLWIHNSTVQQPNSPEFQELHKLDIQTGLSVESRVQFACFPESLPIDKQSEHTQAYFMYDLQQLWNSRTASNICYTQSTLTNPNIHLFF